MKRLKALLLVAIMLIQSALLLAGSPTCKAVNGSANVYIICLNDVPCANFEVDDNQTAKNCVRDGAINAAVFYESASVPWVHPECGTGPPFYGVTYQIVTDWTTYRNVIESYNSCIVVNTHGEIFPIPSGYGIEWINKTADAIVNRSVTWVHTGGYPFYYVWNQGASQKQTWPTNGPFGFKNFTSNVNLPSATCEPTGGAQDYLKGMDELAVQTLGKGWQTAPATYAERGRPLHSSLFQNYTSLSIWNDGDDIYGGIVSFVKVSQRKQYQNERRPGFYVHIGTRNTYQYNQPSHVKTQDENYVRGYIGTAAAIWAEADAFEPTINWKNYQDGGDPVRYASNWTIGVSPYIATYFYPTSSTCKIRIDFPVYGCMGTAATEEQTDLGKMEFYLDGPAPGVTGMYADDTESQVFINSQRTVFHPNLSVLLLQTSKCLVFGAGLFAAFFGVPELGWVARGVGGLQLFADTLAMAGYINYDTSHGVGENNPASYIFFEHTVTKEVTQYSNCRYTEFESLVSVDVEIDMSDRAQWTTVPLRLTINMLDNNHFPAVSLSTGCDIVVYRESGWNKNGFKSTVFFDSFKNGLGNNWQAQDTNPLSGYDYWGTLGSDCSANPCAWCATVGNNSVRVPPYTDTPNYYPPVPMSYDANMNAVLMRSTVVGPYQSIWLLYNLTYSIAGGDYLAVEYCSNQVWDQISGINNDQSYTGSGADRPNVQLPAGTTAIRFRFFSDDGSDTGLGALLSYVEIQAYMPNDGGSTDDAGDTTSQATTMSSNFGYLVGDDIDCYNFTVTVFDKNDEKQICVDLYPPSSTDFEALLYNPRGYQKGGPSQHICYQLSSSDYAGNWTVEIYAGKGFGPYTFYANVEGEGGGCPYVYTWNGFSYKKDNNILPASETGNGTDTKDYYKLEQSLVPLFRAQQTSVYSLQISEFENEHDYIDQVKLKAIDHAENVNIAVTGEGEILTYQQPSSPLTCTDNNGADRLYEISTMNGNVSDPNTYFQGYQDDWLLLGFGRVTAANAKLIIRDDQKCMDVCINVQIRDTNGGWRTVEVLHPRSFWSMEAVNLTAYVPANGSFLVRLLWTAPHRLDYVGLDTSAPAQTTVSTARPILAVHSTAGDVTAKLWHDDENCVELVSGQQIMLAFILPNNVQDTKRDFIFYTNGYYYTITP